MIEKRQQNGEFSELASFDKNIDRPSGSGELASFFEKLKFKGISDETIRKISALIIEGADKILAVTDADPKQQQAKQFAVAQDLFDEIMDELDIKNRH